MTTQSLANRIRLLLLVALTLLGLACSARPSPDAHDAVGQVELALRAPESFSTPFCVAIQATGAGMKPVRSEKTFGANTVVIDAVLANIPAGVGRSIELGIFRNGTCQPDLTVADWYGRANNVVVTAGHPTVVEMVLVPRSTGADAGSVIVRATPLVERHVHGEVVDRLSTAVVDATCVLLNDGIQLAFVNTDSGPPPGVVDVTVKLVPDVTTLSVECVHPILGYATASADWVQDAQAPDAGTFVVTVIFDKGLDGTTGKPEPIDPVPQSSPYLSNGPLTVALSTVNPEMVRRAIFHIATAARNLPDAAEWRDANIHTRGVWLYRPDLTAPAYLEVKLSKKNKNLGYVLLSTAAHDAPIVAFQTEGLTVSEQLIEIAAAKGKKVAKIWRLDTAYHVAEDDQGEAAAAFHNETLVPIIDQDAGTPSLVAGSLDKWKSSKAGYAAAAKLYWAVETKGQEPLWKADAALVGVRASLDLDLFAGPDPALPLHRFNTIDAEGTFCEHRQALTPLAGETDVNLVRVNDLTPLWNQMGDFRHPSDPSRRCASGCTVTAAAIILGWMDRLAAYAVTDTWSRPDLSRAFFRYTTPVSVERLPFSLLAPPLASTYDNTAVAPWGWLGGDMDEPGPGTTAAMDMRRLLTEISGSMGTYCDGDSGNTHWGGVGGFEDFIKMHRLPIFMSTGSNPFGESGFRDNVIAQLGLHGTPGFIHTGGWSGHTEVVNAHYRCHSDYVDYFYLNSGWGGGNNRWVAVGNLMMSTTFTVADTAEIRVSHSGQSLAMGPAVDGGEALVQTVPGGTRLAPPYVLKADGGGRFTIVSSTDKCLEGVQGDGDRWAVVHAECSASGNQRWHFLANRDGSFRIRFRGFDRCLQVADGDVTAEARLDLGPCTGATYQNFEVNRRFAVP
jgi:hypothetical protein